MCFKTIKYSIVGMIVKSDQRLSCPHRGTLYSLLSKIRLNAVKILFRLCANVQADLNLRWMHMSDGTFSDVVAQTRIRKLTSLTEKQNKPGLHSEMQDDSECL